MESTILNDEAILRGLNANPQIKNRIASMLAVVEDTAGDSKEADAAEMRLIEEIRRLGQEAMQAWDSRARCHQAGQTQRQKAAMEGGKNLLGTSPGEQAADLWRHPARRRCHRRTEALRVCRAGRVWRTQPRSCRGRWGTMDSRSDRRQIWSAGQLLA